MTTCTHTDQIRSVEPRTLGCEECLQQGTHWTLLRMCLICGHVGCCDTSPGKHATAHFHATGHPIVKMLDHVEETEWCFIDEIYVS